MSNPLKRPFSALTNCSPSLLYRASSESSASGAVEGVPRCPLSKHSPDQIRRGAPGRQVEPVAAIVSAEPYPHAVEIVNRWHDEGHFIHVTSHRAEHCEPATKQWLDAIGLHYDELYCSDDKIGRCREIDIGLLIDDSPVNIVRALEAGMSAATIRHPWNEDVCEEEDVVCGADWPELARRLDPLLGGDRRAA